MPNRGMICERTYATLPEAYSALVPSFKSHFYAPLYFRIRKWESKYAQEILQISPGRADDRWCNYVSCQEIDRVREFHPYDLMRGVTFRFGIKKEGRGNTGRRDFCLLAAVIRNRDLTVLYRSCELTGGLAFDLVLFDWLGEELGVSWKQLTVFSYYSNVHAVAGGSNQKLYGQLKELFSE
jgi:hypothetical protein